jgi:hypothetical protein
MKSTVVIPDTQIRHGVQVWHLPLVGRYIADHQPDSVVMLGDWVDNPTISKYPDGKIGRLYALDTGAAIVAMEQLLNPIARYAKGYKGRFVMLTGNHEDRLRKYIGEHPELDGALVDPLENFAEMGWKVIPFLKPVHINGVVYAHYFPRSGSGRVMQTRNGAASARVQLQREMHSCTAGHMQGLDYYEHGTCRGIKQSLIAGSCYVHDETYLGPQGNHYFRGIVHKTFDRPNGAYTMRPISVEELKRMYT